MCMGDGEDDDDDDVEQLSYSESNQQQVIRLQTTVTIFQRKRARCNQAKTPGRNGFPFCRKSMACRRCFECSVPITVRGGSLKLSGTAEARVSSKKNHDGVLVANLRPDQLKREEYTLIPRQFYMG